jgi:inhibitor of KinA
MPTLEPLGDQGVLARRDGEADATRWADAVRRAAPPWLLDVVQAYTAVAVFHDPARVELLAAMAWLESLAVEEGIPTPRKLHRIPCCYERGPDLARVAGAVGLSPEEVIRLHTSVEYTVYAIGFCPGFPYLGYLPPELSGIPRLESPRLRVEPGSVGLTGRQTGIYTEPRPGGWCLVGRTPLVLVDVAGGYFPLRTGDRVRFDRIGEAEYARLEGRRLGE